MPYPAATIRTVQATVPVADKGGSAEAGLSSDPLKATLSVGEQTAQVLVLAMLLVVPALMCLHAASIADPDIWWHMRVGEWILQHHAVLRVDIFSREFAGTPWVSYSWLFEVLMFKIYQWFGITGILGYSTTMVLVITIALNRMLRRLQADVSLSTLLTIAACLSFGHLYTPRPWMFSILFFILELDILMYVRKTGRLRALAWLPLIFALWANIHIEFIYGLFAVGLVLAESLAAKWQNKKAEPLPLLPIGFLLTTCVLGTLLNPFGWRIYGVIYNLVTQGGGLKQVSEMQSIAFRDFLDYLVLALALASVGALAWNKRFQIFESGLLLFAIFVAFREQRDTWLISTVATALIAAAIPAREDRKELQLPKFATLVAGAAAACMLLIAQRTLKVNKALLDNKVANVMPVHAVEALREKGYPGPLFNDFNWGGYLIWAWREPVTIDGRTNLYGNERMDRSSATWNAQTDWSSDPELKSARLILGPTQSPLTQLLRLDSHFQLVYEDKLAAAFLRRP